MESLKSEIRGFSGLDARKKVIVIVTLAAILALIIALCISIGIRANIQREYTAARNQAGAALYDNLFILMQTFDSTAVPNIDVRNAILPQMRNYYIASITLNNLLGQTYGARYAVLNEADHRKPDQRLHRLRGGLPEQYLHRPRPGRHAAVHGSHQGTAEHPLQPGRAEGGTVISDFAYLPHPRGIL